MGSRMKSESGVLFQSNYGITPRVAASLVKLFSKEERRTVLGTMKKYMKDWTALIGKEYQKSTLSRYGKLL